VTLWGEKIVGWPLTRSASGSRVVSVATVGGTGGATVSSATRVSEFVGLVVVKAVSDAGGSGPLVVSSRVVNTLGIVGKVPGIAWYLLACATAVPLKDIS